MIEKIKIEIEFESLIQLTMENNMNQENLTEEEANEEEYQICDGENGVWVDGTIVCDSPTQKDVFRFHEKNSVWSPHGVFVMSSLTMIKFEFERYTLLSTWFRTFENLGMLQYDTLQFTFNKFYYNEQSDVLADESIGEALLDCLCLKLDNLGIGYHRNSDVVELDNSRMVESTSYDDVALVLTCEDAINYFRDSEVTHMFEVAHWGRDLVVSGYDWVHNVSNPKLSSLEMIIFLSHYHWDVTLTPGYLERLK